MTEKQSNDFLNQNIVNSQFLLMKLDSLIYVGYNAGTGP